MGGYSQPDFSNVDDSSSLGMGGRRRGLFQTLLGLGQNSQQPWDERMPSGSQREPRLVHLMNGVSAPTPTNNIDWRHASGYQSGQHPTGAPKQLEPHIPPPPGPIPNDQTRSTVPQARFGRIEDDPQSRQHIASLEEGTADLESRVGTTAGPKYRPVGPDEHMQELQSRYQTEANYQPKPLSLLQKIALGVTAPFGSLGGFQDERDRQQQMHQTNARSLLQEIEADKRTNTQEDLATQRMTLQEQMERDKLLQAERLKREGEEAAALRTPFGAWQAQNPTATVGDFFKLEQGAKAQQKPDTPEQQFFDSPEEAGKTLTQKTQDWARAWQRPEQPQRPPQQLAITPDGKVIDLKPGMTIPQGTQSVQGMEKGVAGQEASKDALQYADDYLRTGAFSGPGDEALMEKFFELAKPSSGFRMTDAQQRMLRNSQSWMNRLRAKVYHAATGKWFSDQQHKEIVQAMTQVGRGKTGGGPTKVLSRAAIQQAARDHNVSVDEAEQAVAAGYAIQ